jgi:hypothetical protein
MFKHRKFMTKIVPPKITIYVIWTNFNTILIFVILWSTFIFVLYLKHISLDHYQTHNAFHICSFFPFVHIIGPHNIYIIITKLHKCIKFTIYETKKKVKRRLSTMHNIEMTESRLFHMLNTKCIFSFLIFILTYVPLLIISWTMLTLAHEA